MALICTMHDVHDDLVGVDLNLLLALDALLGERHVTRAAARLNITQSAASHALARLRALTGDPLLVRGPGGAMLPTERAVALAPVVRRALTDVAMALKKPGFEPATAQKTFSIGAIDLAELVLLPGLSARVLARAPGVNLFMRRNPDDIPRALSRGDCDLVISPVLPSNLGADYYKRHLFNDTFICAVRKGHPIAGKRLTLDRFCAMNHLLIAPRGTPGGAVDEALAALGRQRRIALFVPHFLIAPHVIATTDLVVTMSLRLAETFAESHDLVMLKPPVELKGFAFHLLWHERGHADPAAVWLREQIVAVAEEIQRPG